MKHYDCIILHPTTHITTPFSTVPDSVTYIVMPMGTIALADLLNKEGYRTMIVHTGIEQMCDRNFDVENLLRQYDVSIVGIDLHWYCHSYDAIRLAEIVKQNSKAFVALGGFTASFFCEEILSRFKSIDAVIWGDAELPFLELVRNASTQDLKNVPNLVYRDRDSLRRNEKRYVANEADLNRLDFSNHTLLSNFDTYRRNISQFGDIDPLANRTKLKTQGWLCLGRGCSMNCSYCGGGKDAFQILTGRNDPIFRSKEKVVDTLTRYEEMKIECAYMDFDPYPENRKYYAGLFELIRKEKIDISAQFLLWSLSDRGFLRDLKRTFNPLYTTVTISPESGSEQIRRINKGSYYDNSQLLHWLNDTRTEMIPIQAYFTSGLSGETERHFEETIKLAQKMIVEYPVASMSCNPIELEPASPRFLNPRKYGISPRFTTFADFYNLFKSMAEGTRVESYLGYRTTHLSEAEIIGLNRRFQEAVSLSYHKRMGELYPGFIRDMA